MEKGFFEVFSRYHPAPEKLDALERARVSTLRYDKENGRIEAEIVSDRWIDAEMLYEVADECCVLYGVASFRLFPHFPSSLFDLSRMAEIATEAAMSGAVTHGFFHNATYDDNGETIEITIPFFENGVNFVKRADTESILSRILESRYGVRRRFVISSSDSAARAAEEKREQNRRRLLAEAERAGIEQARAQREAIAK